MVLKGCMEIAHLEVDLADVHVDVRLPIHGVGAAGIQCLHVLGQGLVQPTLGPQRLPHAAVGANAERGGPKKGIGRRALAQSQGFLAVPVGHLKLVKPVVQLTKPHVGLALHLDVLQLLGQAQLPPLVLESTGVVAHADVALLDEPAGRGLGLQVPQLVVDLVGLPVAAQGILVVPVAVVQVADAGVGDGLPRPVVRLLGDLQPLLVALEGLLPFPEGLKGRPHVAVGDALGDGVPHLLGDHQMLPVPHQRVLEVVRRQVDQPDLAARGPLVPQGLDFVGAGERVAADGPQQPLEAVHGLRIRRLLEEGLA
mmetsp:Transcript_133652/g.231822  ORF Transcript_133652/g.231822 Transcript_133652/m.231822 type:complete len:311 (-) Transcript_133652:801-1733(-)